MQEVETFKDLDKKQGPRTTGDEDHGLITVSYRQLVILKVGLYLHLATKYYRIIRWRNLYVVPRCKSKFRSLRELLCFSSVALGFAISSAGFSQGCLLLFG